MKPKLSKGEKETIEAIGARLVLERHERNMTQQQMADALGVTKRTYQTYETGERQMSVLPIARASEELGIDIQYLLRGIVRKTDTEVLSDIIGGLDYYLERAKIPLSASKRAAIISKGYDRRINKMPFTDEDLVTWVEFIREE